jgi:hypothetical protein
MSFWRSEWHECGMGEVGERVSKGQAAVVYGTGFTLGSLARI